MPTVDIPDKICPHCGGITYKVQQQGKYTSRMCIVKFKESKKRTNQLYREKNLEYNKKRYRQSEVALKVIQKRKRLSEVKTKVCKTCKETKSLARFKKSSKYAYDNECIACKNKRKFNRDCTNLKDVYIKAAIKWGTNLSSKDIPQNLIELKRKQLLLTRQIKNNGKS
jgi:hypothetical protein